MRYMNARVVPIEDEEGYKPAHATIEFTEHELRHLRTEKVNAIERGLPFFQARIFIEHIAVIDRALHGIRVEREGTS